MNNNIESIVYPPEATKGAAARQKKSNLTHYLGGSFSARQERKIRETLERQLAETRKALEYASNSIPPQLDVLKKSIKDLEKDSEQHWAIEEESQKVFGHLKQQITGLSDATQQKLESLRESLVDKIESGFQELKDEQHQLSNKQDKLDRKIDTLTIEVSKIRGMMNSYRIAVNQRLEQSQLDADSIREQAEEDNERNAKHFRVLEARLTELDTKLFEVDKETLKLRMSLPASLGARACFNEKGRKFADSDTLQSSAMYAADHRLEELQTEVKTLKSEQLSYRSADREQFDSLSNRIRTIQQRIEAVHSNSNDQIKLIQDQATSLALRVPSEVSERLERYQDQFQAELESMRRQLEFTAASSGINGATPSIMSTLEMVQHEMHQVKDQALTASENAANASEVVEELTTRFQMLESTILTRALKSSTDLSQVEKEMSSLYELLAKRLASWRKQCEGYHQECMYQTQKTQNAQQCRTISPELKPKD